jgi:hypothetical protein
VRSHQHRCSDMQALGIYRCCDVTARTQKPFAHLDVPVVDGRSCLRTVLGLAVEVGQPAGNADRNFQPESHSKSRIRLQTTEAGDEL